MATVTEDLKAGHIVQEDRGSFTGTRVFYVTDLVQSAEHQIMEALTDPLIPPYLEKWPPVGEAGPFPEYDKMLARQRRGEPYGKNGVRVEITYSNVARASFNSLEPPGAGNDGPDLKTVDSSTVSINTTVDRGGNPMTLTPAGSFAEGQPYLSTAERLIPVGTLNFLRVEGNFPGTRLRTLPGKVNSLTLSAYAPNTLKLERMRATSQDGTTWEVSYQFSYRADGWVHRDTWRGPDGKAAVDQVEQEFDVLEETDFGVLGLNFSDTQSPW